MALPTGWLKLERFKLDQLYASYVGMSAREQTIALVVSGVLLVLIIVIPVVVASRSLSSLQREIAGGQESFHDIVREVEQYHRARAEIDALEAELSGGFDSSIATTLETLATKVGIGDRIDSLKEKPLVPSDIFEQAAVDVRVKKVRLEELINFLFEIENNPEKILKLASLDVKARFDNRQELDASFSVSTFRLQGVGE